VSWGNGKAIYSADGVNVQYIDIEPHGQLSSGHKFKAIAYSEYRKSEDSGGDRVGFVVKMSDEAALRTSILTYEYNLKNLFGGQAVAKVETTKLLPGMKALLVVSVTDPATNRKVQAHQLLGHLNSNQTKSQLPAAFQNNFVQLVALSGLSRQEVEEYLSKPPPGLDDQIWLKAKKENPDSDRFIPVPLIGFAALNERFKLQEHEVNQQKLRVMMVNDELCTLERSVAATKAKLEEARKRNVPLKNKVLAAMIYLEVQRKRGFPIQTEEETLRAKLEQIQSELNAPTKFKGCLNELMCRVRQFQGQRSISSYSLDESTLNEIKRHLKQEQDGIGHLLAIVKHDSQLVAELKGKEAMI
jgi:nuclear pore complex protein Nup54